jgi:outer membrane receptor for ferrienterochelin and colicins
MQSIEAAYSGIPTSKFLRRVVLPLCLGSFAVSAISAEAQESRVTVRVVSEGVPVEGAQVSYGDRRVLANVRGEAVVPLPAGQHVLRVAMIGYATLEVAVVLEPGADTTVVATLEVEAIETAGIVVTSTRTERRIEDEPLRVEVVSREEVEEKILMTPGDIAMLLNETAGLRVQPTAPSLGGASVRIQGLRGRYTQILSDGLPLYGGQSGALGPLQIPPMDLAQVEVIKGAASALYGATALGGVVNLISRRPQDEREILLNQTTLDGSDAVLWLAGQPSERMGYTVLASAHRQGQADVDDDGWADLPSFRRAFARPRVFWNNGRGSSLFVTVGAMTEDREGGTLAGSTTPAGTSFSENLETRRLDGGVVGAFLLSASRRLTVRGSAMTQGHRHTFGSVVERDRHGTEFGEVAITGEDGRHVWVMGAALQHEQYDATDVPVYDFSYTIPAVFAQDEYAPVRWLALSASARLDHHSAYGAFLNPRLSVLFRPGEWVIRTSAGTGYFAPSPFTEETEAVGLGRLIPFGDLDAERAITAMADVGRTLGPWEVNATVFGSRVQDALVVSPDGSGSLTLSNAAEPVRTWGTELLARYHSGPIHFTGTHVYTRSTELSPDGLGRREVPLTPRNTVGLVGAWEEEGRGRIGAEVYYTGRQSLEGNPYRSASKPYWILGFLVERRFGPARLFVNLENIFDARQTAHDRLVLTSRSTEGEWITDVWAPLEGRAINGGVRLAF